MVFDSLSEEFSEKIETNELYIEYFQSSVDDFLKAYFKSSKFESIKKPNDKISRELIIYELGQKKGVDLNLFNKSRISSNLLTEKSSYSLTKRMYDLKKDLSSKFFKDFKLDKVLEENVTQGIVLSDKRISEYNLSVLKTKNDAPIGYDSFWGVKRVVSGEFYKQYDLWLDAPVAISLFYKGEPNAVISFYPSTENTLFVTQLQGISPNKVDKRGGIQGKFSARGLVVLDWQKLLVDVAASVAHNLNYSALGICSAQNNISVFPDDCALEGDLSFSRAFKMYDSVALRLGFEQKSDKNWYKCV